MFTLTTFNSRKILKYVSKKVVTHYFGYILNSTTFFVLTKPYKPKKINRLNGHGNNRMPFCRKNIVGICPLLKAYRPNKSSFKTVIRGPGNSFLRLNLRSVWNKNGKKRKETVRNTKTLLGVSLLFDI